jgi:hypothetical protein
MGGKKGPLRELSGGQIFGGVDDDDYGDDQELDYLGYPKNSDEEDVV